MVFSCLEKDHSAFLLDFNDGCISVAGMRLEHVGMHMDAGELMANMRITVQFILIRCTSESDGTGVLYI